jgi:hypothetical protein
LKHKKATSKHARQLNMWRRYLKKNSLTKEELSFKFFIENKINHKIVNIEYISCDPTPVYDIEVEKYHNFALNNGTFVHNSSASDIGLLAILLLTKEFDDRGLRSRIYGFVHDQILVDVAPRELDIIVPLQKDIMENRVKEIFTWLDNVPLDVSYEIGVNWGSPAQVEINLKSPGSILLTMQRGEKEELFSTLGKTLMGGYGMRWEEIKEDEKTVFGSLLYGKGV